MMTDIDATFRTKSGKKRDYSFKFNIDTNETEAKLNRVKVLLTDIGELTKGVNLVINAGQKVDPRSIKSQVQVLTSKKELDRQQEENRQKAATAVKSVLDTRKMITRSIGKIHSAVASLERGREVNIKTDVAKSRLEELLVLMRQIRKESNFGMIMPGVPAARSASGVVVPYAYQPEKHLPFPRRDRNGCLPHRNCMSKNRLFPFRKWRQSNGFKVKRTRPSGWNGNCSRHESYKVKSKR